MVNHCQKYFGLIELLNKFWSLYIQKTSTISNFLMTSKFSYIPPVGFWPPALEAGVYDMLIARKKGGHDHYSSNSHLE